MVNEPRFRSAFPYQKDVLALPVTNLDSASEWYCKHFGMTEVERRHDPVPTVILERDGTRIGFAVNGGDPAKDGAGVLVSGIQDIKTELEEKGAKIGNWRVDEWDETALRQRVGVIFQDFARYQMLVGENVGAGDEAYFEDEPRWREAARGSRQALCAAGDVWRVSLRQ